MNGAAEYICDSNMTLPGVISAEDSDIPPALPNQEEYVLSAIASSSPRRRLSGADPDPDL